MLTVDMIGRVRREHARGKSMRKIAAELRLSRDTVAKYLKSGETDGRYRRSRQHYPQLGPHITRWSGCWRRTSGAASGTV